MEKIKIIVVDDHPIFRQGVVDSLNLESDINIVGQFENGESALAEFSKILPDIAIVDVNLPGINGQQLTREIVDMKINTKVVLLTAYDDTEQKIHAIRVGAFAYCSKDILPSKLISVIRNIHEGNYFVGKEFMSPEQLKIWVRANTNTPNKSFTLLGESVNPLSSREMEVLATVTQGMSNKEVARELGISHQTVKNHVTAILRKLGVEDRTQAAVYALKKGWVRLYEQDSES
jgi:two-component system, NarL family, response regulator DegU